MPRRQLKVVVVVRHHLPNVLASAEFALSLGVAKSLVSRDVQWYFLNKFY